MNIILCLFHTHSFYVWVFVCFVFTRRPINFDVELGLTYTMRTWKTVYNLFVIIWNNSMHTKPSQHITCNFLCQFMRHHNFNNIYIFWRLFAVFYIVNPAFINEQLEIEKAPPKHTTKCCWRNDNEHIVRYIYTRIY